MDNDSYYISRSNSTIIIMQKLWIKWPRLYIIGSNNVCANSGIVLFLFKNILLVRITNPLPIKKRNVKIKIYLIYKSTEKIRRSSISMFQLSYKLLIIFYWSIFLLSSMTLLIHSLITFSALCAGIIIDNLYLVFIL